jgi:arginine exporter protein ArgO
MSQISLRQGIVIYVVVFAIPVILLIPFRAEIMAIVPNRTLLQAVNNLLGSAFVVGLAIYAYNQRQQVQALEREKERERSRREQALTDGGDTQTQELRDRKY